MGQGFSLCDSYLIFKINIQRRFFHFGPPSHTPPWPDTEESFQSGPDPRSPALFPILPLRWPSFLCSLYLCHPCNVILCNVIPPQPRCLLGWPSTHPLVLTWYSSSHQRPSSSSLSSKKPLPALEFLIITTHCLLTGVALFNRHVLLAREGASH